MRYLFYTVHNDNWKCNEMITRESGDYSKNSLDES